MLLNQIHTLCGEKKLNLSAQTEMFRGSKSTINFTICVVLAHRVAVRSSDEDFLWLHCNKEQRETGNTKEEASRANTKNGNS